MGFDESWSWWCLLRVERTVSQWQNTWMSVEGNLAVGTLSSKSWYFICSHRRWSDLRCSRRCLHDHPHQTLEKETSQYTPQLVKTVAREIMKVKSVAVRVKKVRDGDYVQLLLELFMNLAHVVKLTNLSAASVTIHRVMDIEHGLGNVTGEIMLSTLLNHWSSTVANQTLSEPIQKELFKIKDFDVVWLPRVYALTLILETHPGRREFLGKHWIQSNSRQFVWLEELWTLSQFKKSLMSELQLTMTVKTPTDKSVCENPDLAECSVEVVDEAAKQRLRVKEESYKAYIEEELSLRQRRKDSSSPTLEALGSR